MVVGDSHAMALMPAFEQVAISRREDVLFAGLLGCPPLLGIAVRGGEEKIRNCQALNAKVLRYVTEHGIPDVLLVASWSTYTDGGDYHGRFYRVLMTATSPPTLAGSRAAFEFGLDETLARYRAAGIRLHIVQKVPTQLRLPTDLVRAVVTSRRDPATAIRSLSVPLSEHHRLSAYDAAEFARRDIRPDVRRPAALLDLDSAYCDREVCAFAEPNVSYYVDTQHLSTSGAKLAAPLIAERFAAIDALRK